MTTHTFGKDAWVEMFRAIGLDEATMGRWHREFETRWPQEHEKFLAWLGLPPGDAARIRGSARSGATHP
jgi:hypothetical protein